MDEYADAYGGNSNFMKMFNYCAQEEYAWLYLQLDTGRRIRISPNKFTQSSSKDVSEENSDLEEDSVKDDEEK